MTIFEFADIIDKDICFTRYPNQNGRTVARFDNCEIKRGVILQGNYGDGKDPMEALKKYAVIISGQRLVFNAGSKDRQEYVVPHLDDFTE